MNLAEAKAYAKKYLEEFCLIRQHAKRNIPAKRLIC